MPKVDAQQLEPCPGAEHGKTCVRGEGALADPAIQGYDKIFRCAACHRIHTELVYQEAGESAPNPGEIPEARPIALSGNIDEARRAAMLNRVARERIRGGRFTNPSPVQARPGDPVDLRSLMSQKESEPKESEIDRRARVIAKYSRRK